MEYCHLIAYSIMYKFFYYNLWMVSSKTVPQNIYLTPKKFTLPPIIMEVENYPKWKETILLEGHIFHFHDYGRKGSY